MTEIGDAWKYTESVPETRRSTLAAPRSFREMIRLVVEDVSVVRVRAKPGCAPSSTHCIQPIFTLELKGSGDALFNGPFGYRAQYLLGPNIGLVANAALLAALAAKLLGAVDTVAEPALAKIDVCQSLAAASAKLWIDEAESASIFANPTRELAVERWVAEADNGVELAKWGLCAPHASRFEVKGALIDAYGNEVVPARKIRRHFDIHHYGFS
jgi:hypothetical protein